MKKITILFIILLTYCSCKTENRIIQSNDKDGIEAIKFMGSLTTQPYSIGEKNFWDSPDEHVKLFIRNNDFVENVKNLTNHSEQNFKEYNYAFIIKNNKKTDTLYSDSSLKSWALKNRNKMSYYYDEEGIIAESLRGSYSFFYDCW